MDNTSLQLLDHLENTSLRIRSRDERYRGYAPLRFAADQISGDLKYFSVNLCRLAVDAVAERMKIKNLRATARGRDISTTANHLWRMSEMDQLIMPILVDTLALGASYLIVWNDQNGTPRITPESAFNVAVRRDPVTNEVIHAVKKWTDFNHNGQENATYVVEYTPSYIATFSRQPGKDWSELDRINNPLGVVPVVPLVNVDRMCNRDIGHSVIDELTTLVDALSKVLADMLVASEDVARPRRWASGVDLEEDHEDGFTADGAPGEEAVKTPVVSPFESENRMFTVESPDAKFGQLPGADLKGYQTAVELILQQIMSVSALPAHMMGVTTANPASADGIRAAEASLTARAESRISVLGIQLEYAAKLQLALATGYSVGQINVETKWRSAATKSTAQEADAITKYFSLGIITLEEAREAMGLDSL